MILAGEIGATKTRLAAFENEGNRLNTVVEKTYLSQQESSLPNIISNFVKTEGIPVHSACFGVAGPVRGKTCKISNLTWTIDADELAGLLKLKSVGLINDLEAYAYGIDGLESKDFVTLSAGHEDATGNRAVISARTGLGVAGLYWDGFRHHPFACEGGHSSFSPGNELEIELLQYLHKKHGRVSCERVLSGPGIKSIYEFLRDTGKEQEPDWLKEEIGKAPDGPAADLATGAGEKGPHLRKDAGDLRGSIRLADWRLRADIHEHGRDFYWRQHRGEDFAFNAGSDLHAGVSGEGSHARSAQRHSGEDCAERQFRHGGSRALYSDPKSF